MQKKAKQLIITSFLYLVSTPPPAMHSTQFSNLDVFHTRTLPLPQYTPTLKSTYLMIINLCFTCLCSLGPMFTIVVTLNVRALESAGVFKNLIPLNNSQCRKPVKNGRTIKSSKHTYYGAVTLLQILANRITLYAQIIHCAQLKCCYDKGMIKISPRPSDTQDINDLSNNLSLLACTELQCMIGTTQAVRWDAITLSIP